MSELILTTQRGPLYEITLNNPGEGNAATDPMTVELKQTLDGVPPEAEFIVLRGAGDDFCAGRSPRDRFPMPAEALGMRDVSDAVFDCYDAFRRTKQPIVAIVQGRALGFGCAIAGLADITIAGASATFGVPEMAHNRFPTMVMSALVDRVGRKALTYLVWSSAVVSAERALTWGLVSDVVPDAELAPFAEALLARLMKPPKPAIRAVKDFARVGFDLPVPGAVDFARNLHATVNSSSEMHPRG